MFEKPKKKEKKPYKGLKQNKPLKAKTKMKQRSNKKRNKYDRPEYKIWKCPFCGRPGRHYWHHVFNGAFKEKSEKYNALEYPCWNCHELDNGSIEKDAKWKRQLKQKHQRRIMKELNWTMNQWIIEFGANYLEEDE